MTYYQLCSSSIDLLLMDETKKIWLCVSGRNTNTKLIPHAHLKKKITEEKNIKTLMVRFKGGTLTLTGHPITINICACHHPLWINCRYAAYLACKCTRASSSNLSWNRKTTKDGMPGTYRVRISESLLYVLMILFLSDKSSRNLVRHCAYTHKVFLVVGPLRWGGGLPEPLKPHFFRQRKKWTKQI